MKLKQFHMRQLDSRGYGPIHLLINVYLHSLCIMFCQQSSLKIVTRINYIFKAGIHYILQGNLAHTIQVEAKFVGLYLTS